MSRIHDLPLVTEVGDLDEFELSLQGAGSRRARRIDIVSGGSVLRPEQFGAAGDGSSDDASAFNLAIAEAMSTGRLLQGSPHKRYYIGSDLSSFASTLRISDCHFVAPNGVRILIGNPAWASENTTVTGLAPITGGGSTYATQVNLTNTTGLAVGDWVMVGSRSQTWPANSLVWWFESGQITSLVANANIALNRRMLGESTGLLTANLSLFKIPNYRVEASRLRFSASGDPLASGQLGREQAIEIRGGLNHVLENCHADSWWGPFIQIRSTIKCRIINPSWNVLPDIPTDSEAFGYGVQEMGASYGTLITGMNGGQCRHGYTNSSSERAVYPSSEPWVLGIQVNSTIAASKVTNHSHMAFDTHNTAIGTTFSSCDASDPIITTTGGGSAANFHDRAFRTKFIGCTSRGGRSGFFINTAESPWSTLGDNVVTIADCCSDGAEDAAIRLEDDQPGTTVLVNNFTALYGDDAVFLEPSFVGRLIISRMTAIGCSGSIVDDTSGDAEIKIIGLTANYAGLAAAAPLLRVTVTGSGSWLIHDATIIRRTTGSPNGLVQVDFASALPITLGQVAWDLGATLPDLSPASTGGASLTVTEMKFRV